MLYRRRKSLIKLTILLKLAPFGHGRNPRGGKADTWLYGKQVETSVGPVSDFGKLPGQIAGAFSRALSDLSVFGWELAESRSQNDYSQ